MQTKVKKTRRLFSPAEAAQVQQDMRGLQEKLQSPYIQDKENVHKTLRRMSKMEEQHGIPNLNPQQRDQAAKRIAQIEDQLKVGMLSSEEMRRNPPGAVDQNVWWERRNKQSIIQRRNLIHALNKGMPADQCQELASIERLRPRQSRLSMENAQIPQARAFSFPSDAYSANWDQIFGPKPQEEVYPIEEAPTEPEPITAEALFDDEGEDDVDPVSALSELSKDL